MMHFGKKKPLPIPQPFRKSDIRIESSICTGEQTIGFYDKSTRTLRFAELVRSEQDIIDFYARYGLKPDTDKT